MTALAVGYSIARHMTLLYLIFAAFALALLVLKPNLAIYATIVLAFGAFPDSLRLSIHHPKPQIIYFYEITLTIAAIYCARSLRPRAEAARWISIFVLVVGLAIALGFYRANSPNQIFRESHLLDLALGYYVAASVINSEHQATAMKVAGWTLVEAATMAVLGPLLGVRLAGREETTHLGDNVAADATRVLGNAQFLALAVVCILLALYLAGFTPSVNRLSFWLAPSLVLLLLAFSRNSIIALAATAVFTLLTMRSSETLRRITAAAGVVLAVVVPSYLLLRAALPENPLVKYLASQIQAYQLRVFGGLSGSAIQTDPSAQYRLLENTYLVRAINENPVIGHGLGYAYKPPMGTDPSSFEATLGQFYAHNFYLWIAVKAGLVGATAVLWFAGKSVMWALRSHRPAGVAVGAAASAFLVVCLVAPLPLDPSNNLIFGVMLGLAAAQTRLASDQALDSELIDGTNRESIGSERPTPVIVRRRRKIHPGRGLTSMRGPDQTQVLRIPPGPPTRDQESHDVEPGWTNELI
ncbi:O-antigen ligase family protein [Pseudofrankia sp. DC12]|uniref:O-antigen ligase family protein n=1 Tax=Pseudofrankia sp. DC12 TaxID=683315 RepID=UPI0018DC85CE|nr:O-antigen ligase family protein [Pseudofrankia sp. DC12]